MVTAQNVQARIGGDLIIESLQDRATYSEKSESASAGVSLCIPPLCYGASSISGGAGKTGIDSTYASVKEQSAIRAGDGGFDVTTRGKTTLIGGAITSTQAAVDAGANRFDRPGGLELFDVHNQAAYQAEGYSVNASLSRKLGDQGTAKTAEEKKSAAAPTGPGGGAGIGSDKGSASSVTASAISGIAGDKAARSGDAGSGIAPIFDRQRVKDEVDAQVAITAEFGKQASKAVGDYATSQLKQAGDLREQANGEFDLERKTALIVQAEQLESNWGDSGSLRLLAHTTIGALTGGTAGAAGAAVGTLTAPIVANALQEAGVEGPLKDVITAAASTALGAGAGSISGAAAAYNEVQNNFLTHAEASRRLKLQSDLQACADESCRSTLQAEIDRLNRLDSWRDEQIEEACKSPASDACRGWSAALNAAAKSYHGQYGNLVDTAERSSVQQQAFLYQQATNNPFMHGVGKGLLKLTPPGLLVGAVGGVAMTVQSIVENGLSQTLIVSASAITNLPANLNARLNSPDPSVRGEALVDLISLSSGVTAVTAGGVKVTIDSVKRSQVAKAVAEAETKARNQARIDNNFWADGASSSPVGLQTSAGIIPPNPHRTTTVLGRFASDMNSVINEQMHAHKSLDFGARPGGFNALNVDDSAASLPPEKFFKKINKPFLDEALHRGDDIALATIPQMRAHIIDPDTGNLIGIFAQELKYLVDHDYKPVNISNSKWIELKGWLK